MMTMSRSSLAAPEQELIDARLDTIERMLMGRVPRSDRVTIVEEVESQIYELMGERDPHSMTSEDVLDILRRLDPPEAYLTNDIEESERVRPIAGIRRSKSSANHRPSLGSEGRIGGITGICAFGLMLLAPLLWFLALSFQSEGLLLIGLGGMTLIGIVVSFVGLILSIRCCRQGALPVFGIVGSALALPFWLLVCPFFLFWAMN